MKQLQTEREEARATKEALELQVLAERRRADDERDARMKNLEEELARVRAEFEHEKQQCDHDEEMQREAESQKIPESDEKKQRKSETTGPLVVHHEDFRRKKKTADERWRENMEWREETNRQLERLVHMVQSFIQSYAEAQVLKGEKARQEEEDREEEQARDALRRRWGQSELPRR